jgi:hypothetical protein
VQGGREDQYEVDAGKDAVADRQIIADVVADDMPTRPTGVTAADDERHRARFPPNMNEYPEEKPSEFWNRVYIAVVTTTFIVITLLWAFSRYFSS